MNKIIIGVIMLLGSIVAGAQTTTKTEKDTILVSSANIKFTKETYETKDGKAKVDYLALIDGEWYYTNKTSYKKYLTIKKFGGTPTVCFVKPKETKVKTTPKVIVL